MNESMPSSAQPPHAAQKPRTWLRVSGVGRDTVTRSGMVGALYRSAYSSTRGRQMRILLAPHGTRGDIQPMIALGLALRARGHDAAFLAPQNFVGWIRGHGFPC